MKIVKLESYASRDELLGIIKNSELVNDRVKFDENKGKPLVHVKEKGEWLRIKCEMIGGPTKDNGFLVGTYFSGKLTEKDGETRLKGYLVTAPIYHAILIGFFVWFVVQCFMVGGFSPVPPLLVLFDVLLFKDEFKKQGYITRYLYRAVRILRGKNKNY